MHQYLYQKFFARLSFKKAASPRPRVHHLVSAERRNLRTICGRQPGGCELGPRPIDLHLSALRTMGYAVEDEGGRITCRGRGKPSEVHLTFPSVGATENILLSATAIPGTTRIVNAAREPEIEDLAAYLGKCGAVITGAGSSVIHIEGGRKLCAAEHTILPDRIAAATFAAACAAAGGEVLLKRVIPAHFSSVTALLEGAGCRVRTAGDAVEIVRGAQYAPFFSVRTMPYPGFPTDAQAVMMAAALGGKGISAFTETIFESRFRHAEEMRRMGADIRLYGRSALVFGGNRLCGADVAADDLRGGAALMLAALAAEGESTVDNMKYVERGYDGIVNALCSLGAEVSAVG